VVQPLAGEYAGRRRTLKRIPFVSGYGVEIAMLIDLLDLVGLDALAQVDLGERFHRHQGTEALGRMSAQIMVTAWSRLHRRGLVAFVDADLREFSAHFVTGLLGPLLSDRSVEFVKGFYHRPLVGTSGVEPDGGGRVTELVARPLLNLFWPRLAGMIQPLAGEYAGRRRTLERVPFVSGYGVEIAMLIDLLDLVGLDALAQVDLGQRLHRHQGTEALGRMSAQIMVTAWSRLHRRGLVTSALPPSTLLTQFRRGGADALPHLDREIVLTDVGVTERPPLNTVASRSVSAA